MTVDPKTLRRPHRGEIWRAIPSAPDGSTATVHVLVIDDGFDELLQTWHRSLVIDDRVDQATTREIVLRACHLEPGGAIDEARLRYGLAAYVRREDFVERLGTLSTAGITTLVDLELLRFDALPRGTAPPKRRSADDPAIAPLRILNAQRELAREVVVGEIDHNDPGRYESVGGTADTAEDRWPIRLPLAPGLVAIVDLLSPPHRARFIVDTHDDALVALARSLDQQADVHDALAGLALAEVRHRARPYGLWAIDSVDALRSAGALRAVPTITLLYRTRARQALERAIMVPPETLAGHHQLHEALTRVLDAAASLLSIDAPSLVAAFERWTDAVHAAASDPVVAGDHHPRGDLVLMGARLTAAISSEVAEAGVCDAAALLERHDDVASLPLASRVAALLRTRERGTSASAPAYRQVQAQRAERVWLETTDLVSGEVLDCTLMTFDHDRGLRADLPTGVHDTEGARRVRATLAPRLVLDPEGLLSLAVGAPGPFRRTAGRTLETFARPPQTAASLADLPGDEQQLAVARWETALLEHGGHALQDVDDEFRLPGATTTASRLVDECHATRERARTLLATDHPSERAIASAAALDELLG